MKKFFYSLVVLCFSVTTADAQVTDQQKAFILQAFPGYMPEYVVQNTEVVTVTIKYAKKHKTLFQYVELSKGVIYQGSVRIGDTLMVFNGKPFYSKGQALWMYPISMKKKRATAQRAPKSPEQKAQNAQLIGGLLATGMTILSQTTGISGGRNGYYH